MSFKNHGPGGCCCITDCCYTIWDYNARNSNSGWWYSTLFDMNNPDAIRHPLYPTSNRFDWTPIPTEGSSGGYFGKWNGLYTPPGGSSRSAVMFIGGGDNSVQPNSWNLIFGGSIEFDLSVSNTPGGWGIFLGEVQRTDGSFTTNRSSAGNVVYVEFADDGLYATPAGGGVNFLSQQIMSPPIPSGHATRRLIPQLDGNISDNDLGYMNTGHTAIGHRTQVPDYDVSTKSAKIRIEFWSRHSRNWAWAKFHVNDYHLFNMLLPTEKVGFVRTSTYFLGLTAGWQMASAADIQQVHDDTEADVGLYPRSLFGNTYDGQGFITPNPNCVYTATNMDACFNSMSNALIEETHPTSAYPPSIYGPPKSSGCPDPPDFEMFGINFSEQTDLIPEGMQLTAWERTPNGYANPNHRPNWQTWSGTFHGLGGTLRYFEDESLPAYDVNDGVFYRTRIWAPSSEPQFSFTMFGQPYISELTSLQAYLYGSAVHVVALGRYEWDGELAPPSIISQGTWRMELWRTLWHIGAMENYTFGESGSEYYYRFHATGTKPFGNADEDPYVQALYDEIWGSSWELSVSVT